MPEKKRLPAYKVRIASLMSGRYVHNEGLVPKYVLTKDGRRLTRVRMLATVVNKFISQDKKFYSATLDDGTETIRAKAFGSFILDPINIGDIIDIIGKVRKYNEEVYVIPETVWKADPNMELLRHLELQAAAKDWEHRRSTILSYSKQTSDTSELKKLCTEVGIPADDVEGIMEAQEMFAEDLARAEADKTAVKTRVLDLITKHDAGEGCDYSHLIESAGLEENVLDSTVQELLDEGTCFEPRPGKIKKL
jgi:RPA family protein